MTHTHTQTHTHTHVCYELFIKSVIDVISVHGFLAFVHGCREHICVLSYHWWSFKEDNSYSCCHSYSTHGWNRSNKVEIITDIPLHGGVCHKIPHVPAVFKTTPAFPLHVYATPGEDTCQEASSGKKNIYI